MERAPFPDEFTELTDPGPEKTWERYRSSGMAELIGAFHLCQALYALEKVGLIAHLLERHSISLSELPNTIEPRLTSNLLKYLVIRGVLVEEKQRFVPTDRGHLLLEDVPRAQLGFYLDAYGPVTSNLTGLLQQSAEYGRTVQRNGEALGRHCATLFEVFHTATVLEALRGRKVRCLLDLGCGGGKLLIDACLRDPNLRGIGLDISPAAIELARRLTISTNLTGRLQFVVGDAFQPETWPEACRRADALCAVGVLHEHFRDGEQAVISILNEYARLMTEGFKAFILGEPELYYDDRENDSDLFLVHIFTNQGFPRRREEWLRLFLKTDLRCRRLLRRPDAGPRFAFFDLVPA